MKIISLVFAFVFSFGIVDAHKEWIHFYLTKESFSFLQNVTGCQIPQLRDKIGINKTPDEIRSIAKSASPWITSVPIAVGSWGEDVTDPVWGYKLLNGWTASVTHFWDADEGDDGTLEVENSTVIAANALYKAKAYLFGIENIFIQQKEFIGSTPVLGYLIKYKSLVDFFKTGTCTENILYMDINGNFQTTDERQITLSTAQMWAYQIIGRVAHLLQDMSVPAHVRNHMHPCPVCRPDYYEMEMGGSWSLSGHSIDWEGYKADCENIAINSPHAYNYSAVTAANQGGIIQEVLDLEDEAAIRYLFYTLNQSSDFFPSGVNKIGAGSQPDGCNVINPFNSIKNNILFGNINLPNGSNSYLQSRYAALGTPPATIKVDEIANETFNYAIRATATLFYWFYLKINSPEINSKSTQGSISIQIINDKHDYFNPLKISGLANVSNFKLDIGQYEWDDHNHTYVFKNFHTIELSNPQNTFWWDGKNGSGNELLDGNYTGRIWVKNFTEFKNMEFEFQKLNYVENPTIVPSNFSMDAIKKPPIACAVPKIIYVDETLNSDKTLSDNLFQAAESITFDNVKIRQGSHFTFKAGEEIVLKAGTIIEAGSDVVLSIEACDGYLPITYGPCDFPPTYNYRMKQPQDSIGSQINVNVIPQKELNNKINKTLFSEDQFANTKWIKVNVYNSMGQKIMEINNPKSIIQNGILRIENNHYELSRGIYFFHFIAHDNNIVKKMVKL